MNNAAEDITRTYPEICKTVELKIGKKISKRKKKFALLLFTNLGNKAKAARDSGTCETSAKQRGYFMANEEDVQALLEELESIDLDMDNVTEETIKKGILREALTATNSRDIREAWHLLGKNKGMFRDVHENIDKTQLSDDDLLDNIEKSFGKEARDKAEQGLGLKH